MELFLSEQSNQAIKELISDAEFEQRLLEKTKSESEELDRVKTVKNKPHGLVLQSIKHPTNHGKFHLKDTWTIHTKFPKLEIEEKK